MGWSALLAGGVGGGATQHIAADGGCRGERERSGLRRRGVSGCSAARRQRPQTDDEKLAAARRKLPEAQPRTAP
jgi:hypothetical protein